MGRFNAVACGRRFGKTTLAVNRVARPALDGHPVGWFAPNFKYLLEAWADLARILRPVIVRKSEQQRRIELVTGGTLEFWSLEDPDSGRSRKYKHVVIDEAAKARHLEYAWTYAIQATLADLEGSADLYSTPRGMDFFARAFAWGQDPAMPDWSSWRMPTEANPFIPRAEVERFRDTLPERVYQQEIEAQFLESAGGVFRNVRACVSDRRTNEPRRPAPTYSLGVDLARVEDFTVLSVLDSYGRQVYFERFNQISWERQVEAIGRVARQYDATLYLDSTGVGDPIFESVRKLGVRVVGYGLTNASKEALIDNLAIKLEHAELSLMDLDVQTNELLAYQYELTPSRNVRMSAPEGMHDDCVIALALAAWGLANRTQWGVA